ncbi:hypothetical protein F2Q70_00025226 [Brassica cretica]|uniref:RNase H type-1 domain-containing protein n=1 Tax=Brassica cretica TaxID=69181 RepID=A0A8S9LAL7_BRACR|nr:hypothetical protein F2Q68_00024612 [Brassica cretica]KAF2603312.1 hypothetical protein F2Q70_00025226 [Brassica cretica]
MGQFKRRPELYLIRKGTCNVLLTILRLQLVDQMRHGINGQKRARVAWILTDSAGSHINQGAATHEFVSSPLIAEAIALRSGLLSAVNLGLPKLRLFSDNTNVHLSYKE